MNKSKVFHTNRRKGFFIDHSKRIGPYHMGSKHYHSQYEIYYLLLGDRNYFIHDQVYNIKKGDLVLINSNILHSTLDGSLSSHERLLIEFDMSFFDGFLVDYNNLGLLDCFYKDCNILRLEDSERKQIENCFFKILQESKENNSQNSIELKVYFLELLILINKFHSNSNTLQYDYPSKLHKRIYEIITYINSNYNKEISLDLVSKKFFISSAHLSRSFKSVTGFTFIEYLNNLRVKEAQKLLIETPLTISQITEKVGYQNTTHFGRMFKLITGSSPREFRKLNNIYP
ncbi:MAG: AraC family transcriptional regulator [Clostridium sp.]|uniref:AraC family transcriptional regulator n=1 Tax=Clostridium sp. TaxID=1506 RepID=UPI0029062324|nr:AraC family transcriptional regulator [Clostridium sp.]MDU5110695.1 AraC family transcriptional regulator [Clostridium sp.]